MKQIITITTDFCDQFAVAQLHAVMADLGFNGKVVENHGVTPFSILERAFQIDMLTKYSPDRSVHLGVVDPGVGSKRQGIVIKTKRSWFVGPDNGLLFPAAFKQNILHVWKLNESFFGKQVSNTFHGRDVFLKAAVYLTLGKNPEDFGCRKIESDSLIPLVFEKGQVLHVDSFGNIKIHWPRKIINNSKLVIKTKDINFTFPVVKTFSDVQLGNISALYGSSGTLELVVNLGSASKKLGVKLGDILTIKDGL